MKTLDLFPVSEIDQLAYPEAGEDLNLDSSALAFFTDFLRVKPLVIESTVSAIEAKKLMQKAHVRMKIIVNENNQFVGVVSADDLIDREIVKKVAQGEKRDDIALSDFMTSKENLKALDIREIEKSKISDVIMALKTSGQQHCLVVDRTKHLIRGVFSASDISRRLRLPVDIQEKSSFYKVFTATDWS